MNILQNTKKLIADMVTPVSLYLKLRNRFENCLLLESSDYNSRENNSMSFLCAESILTISAEGDTVQIKSKHGVEKKQLSNKNFTSIFNDFVADIHVKSDEEINKFNGLFGYFAYNSVRYFENIELENKKTDSAKIPSLHFSFFKYLIVFNHFNSDLTVIENLQDGEISKIASIEELIKQQKYELGKFSAVAEESSNITDNQFITMVQEGKKHCKRGDVFQIVLSRQFSQKFAGDDFNVYRTLRSINPSPYLFYFDYSDFRLMGSSPEAQIKIANGEAIINPIAGTYKRTGNATEDEKLAQKLLQDKKENAEHVMLVDLARNDLSRNAKNVTVAIYKEIQYFSHVIHLVSTVKGDFQGNSPQFIADTFPAGTLSGAPKHRAMQLIDKYENQDRGFYGGAVGFIGLNGDVNLAIAIRSFVSKNDTLYYQAGAGIVEQSNEISELNEVQNKLSALKKAVLMAEKL